MRFVPGEKGLIHAVDDDGKEVGWVQTMYVGEDDDRKPHKKCTGGNAETQPPKGKTQ